MRAPTILHLIDTGGPGGAETIYCELASGLDSNRWRSVLAVPEAGWLFDTLRERGLEPRIIPTRGSFDIQFLRRLEILLRKEHVDLIQAHLLTSGVYGGLAGTLRRVPVICTLHGEADFGLSVPSRRAKMRLLGALSTRVVAVSESLRRSVVGAGVPTRKTQVIHNGIDTQIFGPGRDQSFRDELAVNNGEVLIGAVGNVRPSKDYTVLLRAAATLRGGSVRYRFVIVGEVDGPLYDELISLRRKLDLEDTVTFTGFRRDVPRVLHNLDLFVITSSTEGFSLTTIQAMTCGVPVIATRCGGPEEIIEDGVTGVLVPAGCPDEVARAIKALGTDLERRGKLARAARDAVHKRFTRAAMLHAYQDLYDLCLHRNRRSRRSR